MLSCETIHFCQCSVFLKVIRSFDSDVPHSVAESRGGPDGSVGEKVCSYLYFRIPMLCILDLVSTEQITHCEMAVIWSRRNTVEIRS